MGQLTRENAVYTGKTKVYTYDNGGNILKESTYAYSAGALGTVEKEMPYGYGDANWKDKLTSYDGQEITYDEIGNPLSYRGYTLGWQNGRQLGTLSGNGVDASYKYDANGLRTEKTVNGVKTTYYYVGEQLMYEKRGDNQEFYYFYDENSTLSGIKYFANGQEYNYIVVTNWRGDTEAIYNLAGGLIAQYTYDAWGNVISVKDANNTNITSSLHIGNANPIRYRGYYMDSETGMYYLQSRYYDATTHRFLNADYLLGANQDTLSNNLYAYCSNNPINYHDESGEGKRWNAFMDWLFGKPDPPAENLAMGAGHASGAITGNTNSTNSSPSVSNAKKKSEYVPRKDKKKGSEKRQPSGDRERNKKHPNGEEHSIKAKGNGMGVRRIVGISLAATTIVVSGMAIVYLVANDITGVGIADDAAIVPCVAVFTKAVAVLV